MFTSSAYRTAALAILSSSLFTACGGGGKSNSGSTGSTGPNPGSPASFTVGGTVSGLGAGEFVVLRNNGGNDLVVNGSASFAFVTPLATGAAYVVTVATQPTGKSCSVTAGNGSVATANVTSVQVACVGLLQITTPRLPNGVQGVNYAAPISATGGLAPYGLALGNGQLPPGLALGINGLGGVPAAGGSYAFEVQGRDAAAPPQTTTRPYQVLILEITTKTAANGIIGQHYHQALIVVGEVGRETWALAPTSAPLPPGTGIPPGSAVINGTATQGGVYTVDLQATDQDSPARTHTQRLTIRILEITTNGLPDGTEQQPYSQQLAVTGELGAVTWALAPGSGPLPPGLTLDADGTIGGTPTQTGTFPLTVQVSDSDSPARTHTRDLGITIDAMAPVTSFEVVNVLDDGTPENNLWVNNRLLPMTKQFSINHDGRYVAFTTASGRALLRDTCKGNAPADCVPSTVPVSDVPSDATRIAFSPTISADGRWVAYRSTSATEDIDHASPNNGSAQFYVYRTCVGESGSCVPRRLLIPERLDGIPDAPRGVVFPGAIGPAISANGRFVLFSVLTDAGISSELTMSGQRAVLVHDRDQDGDGIFDEPGDTRNHVVSHRDDGTLFGDDVTDDDFPVDAALSGDGNKVAMVTDTPMTRGLIWEHDLATNFTFNLIDLIPPIEPMFSLHNPDLSFDGRTIAFTSTNAQAEHVFRGRRFAPLPAETDSITPSVTSGFSTDFQPPSLSSTGRLLAFSHFSDELGVGNSPRTIDVFVWDSCPPGPESCTPTLRAITGTLPNGTPTTMGSTSPRLSGDGAYVVFVSADALDPNVPTAPGFQRIYIAPTGVRE
jgi:Tol biopolymer transport system component